MDLLSKMKAYASDASWAVWQLDASENLTGDASFPNDQALGTIHGRTMVVSLNPGSEDDKLNDPTTPDWSNFHNPAPVHNDIFLAEAFVDTPLWGSYMTDLHPTIKESDSRLVRSMPQEIQLAVESLIRQAKALGNVESIVCVGGKTYESVVRYRVQIAQELGLSDDSIIKIPHYSGANAGMHRHDPKTYRSLVHASMGWS